MTNRRVLLVLSRLVMEGAWLTALVAFCSLLTGAGRSAMPGAAVILLVFSAYGAGFVLQHLDLPVTALRLLGMLLAAAVVNGAGRLLVAGQGDFWNVGWPFDYVGGEAATLDQGRQTVLVLGLGVFLWWRGTRLAEDFPTFDGVLGAFRTGVVLVALQAIIEGFVPVANGASAMTMPFFMAGLLALVLAHLERVDRAQAIEFRGLGLLVPLGTIGAIGLLGALFGLLPYRELGRVLAYLGEVVNFATTYVLFVFFLGAGLLAELIINSLNWLLSFLERSPIVFRNPASADMLETLQQSGDQGNARLIFDIIRYFFLGVLLLLALAFLTFAFRRYRKRSEEDLLEERTSLWDQSSEPTDFPGWLQRLLAGMLGKGPFGIPSGLEGVLRLYFRLLQWAAGAGILREPWHTPFEFQGQMEKALKVQGGEVERITRAFAEARYGHHVPPPAELARLEADFLRLREGSRGQSAAKELQS